MQSYGRMGLSIVPPRDESVEHYVCHFAISYFKRGGHHYCFMQGFGPARQKNSKTKAKSQGRFLHLEVAHNRHFSKTYIVVSS